MIPTLDLIGAAGADITAYVFALSWMLGPASSRCRRQETSDMLTPDRTDLVAGSGATIAARLLRPPRIRQL